MTAAADPASRPLFLSVRETAVELAISPAFAHRLVVEAESEPESDELVEIKRALERHDRHLVEVLARLTAVAASVTAVAITLDDLLGK